MKPIFNPFDYDEHTVMYCPDYESIVIFLTCLNDHDLKWCTGESYMKNIEDYKRLSYDAFRFRAGKKGNLQTYKSLNPNYIFLEFDDFQWEEENYDESQDLSNFLNSFA